MKHLSIAVTTLCVLALTLSGCFAPENPCHQFQVIEKNIYTSVWKVDTFEVLIRDTIHSYYKDTTFANDGTFEFIPNKPYTCDKSGVIKFTRANGEVIMIDYSFNRESMDHEGIDYRSISLMGKMMVDSFERNFYYAINVNLEPDKMVFGLNWDCYWFSCYSLNLSPQSNVNAWRFCLSK